MFHQVKPDVHNVIPYSLFCMHSYIGFLSDEASVA